MSVEWEEQQTYTFENLDNEYCRLLLMIHSIPKRQQFHVLTHVYVAPSPEVKEVWRKVIDAGASFLPREMAITAIGAMSHLLGTPRIKLGRPWRMTLQTEAKDHSGFIFLVVICSLEAPAVIEVDLPLAGILESIAIDELKNLRQETTRGERAKLSTISLDAASPRRLEKRAAVSPMEDGRQGRTTYILGAGASHNYPYCPFGVSPPLARSFFSAYHSMHLSWDLSARVGDVINYLRDFRGLPTEQFWSFDDNIEDFMTEVDERLRSTAEKFRTTGEMALLPEMMRLTRVYDQLIFFLSHVLNETQNGPRCPYYDAFAQQLAPEDSVITLNWDTILDKVLLLRGWDLTVAYGIPFTWVLRSDWRRLSTDLTVKPTRYFKLHGSANWLIRYLTRNLQTGERCMIVGGKEREGTTFQFETQLGVPAYGVTLRAGDLYSFTPAPIPRSDEAAAWPLLFVDGSKPFRAYQDRYRGGYRTLAYFFPPNHPEDDVPLVPLIIPPTRHKLYGEFSHIFGPLWHGAEVAVQEADQIVLAGYSLPPTDLRTIDLLQSAARVGRRPKFRVVGPSPEAIAVRLRDVAGIPADDISLINMRFGEFCGC